MIGRVLNKITGLFRKPKPKPKLSDLEEKVLKLLDDEDSWTIEEYSKYNNVYYIYMKHESGILLEANTYSSISISINDEIFILNYDHFKDSILNIIKRIKKGKRDKRSVALDKIMSL